MKVLGVLFHLWLKIFKNNKVVCYYETKTNSFI